MGTNFYARTNICDCCERYDEFHIGKSSAGWTFSFQAHEDEIQIKSYKDWLELLSNKNVKIFNEYDQETMLDKFKLFVKSKRKEKSNHAKQYPDGSFLDEDGNSFTWGDFS